MPAVQGQSVPRSKSSAMTSRSSRPNRLVTVSPYFVADFGDQGGDLAQVFAWHQSDLPSSSSTNPSSEAIAA
jgi:hypothetical protein